MADDVADKTAGKTGKFFQKHKSAVYVLAGLAVVIVIWMLFKGNSAASTANTANTAPASPVQSPGGQFGDNTGFGVPGPAGPAGPAGPTGPAGPPGPAGKPPPKPKPKHHKGPPDKKTVSGIQATPALTANRQVSHTVQPGETSATVAMRHGMDVSTLHGMNAGKIGSQGTAHPGQRLTVR